MKKRGFAKSKENKKIPLTDNNLVEEALGHLSIICVEDMIESLWKPEESSDEVRKALWPFQLAAKREEFDQLVTHPASKKKMKKSELGVGKGGLVGFVGEKINEFVKQLI